jgi:hypothetical protein
MSPAYLALLVVRTRRGEPSMTDDPADGLDDESVDRESLATLPHTSSTF